MTLILKYKNKCLVQLFDIEEKMNLLCPGYLGETERMKVIKVDRSPHR
jgi:hypothetical protein